jgi:hypothetical protein
MTQQMLEILIGKFLDAEISPVEKQMLDSALERDPQAKDLFNQLKELHELNQQAVSSDVIEKGRSAEDIFEDAWHERKRIRLPYMVRAMASRKFAAGIAAGLLLGIFLLNYIPATKVPRSRFASPFVQSSLEGTQSKKIKGQGTPQLAPGTIRLIPTNNINGELLIQLSYQIQYMQKQLDEIKANQPGTLKPIPKSDGNE